MNEQNVKQIKAAILLGLTVFWNDPQKGLRRVRQVVNNLPADNENGPCGLLDGDRGHEYIALDATHPDDLRVFAQVKLPQVEVY